MNAEVLESIIETHLPAASRGDQQAYGRIVHGCQNTVTSIALAIVRDVPASEDIAQEAFISAWQNLKKLNSANSFLPWLRQITRNLARDYLRGQKYRANPAGDIEAMMLSLTDPAPGPSESLAEQEDAKIAAAVIDALPEESREVLLLYYREGQSTQQVASLLGMQDAAVRKRLSRARQSIREELLQRTGHFAKCSAPSFAFTTVVTTALAIGAPPTATASVLASAAAGGSIASKGITGIALGAIASVAIGLVAGLIGAWGSIAHFLIKPFDAKEKRGLIAYGIANSVLVIAFTAGIFYAANSSDWVLVMLCMGFVLCLMAATFLWLPRILKRRVEHDRDHYAAACADAQPVGFLKQISALYDRNSPRYQFQNNRMGNMHFWMTGVPSQFIAPFDAQEKRELGQFVVVTCLLCVGFMLGIIFVADMKGWLPATTVTTVFMASMIMCMRVWLPKILQRRKAFEKARDPIAFERNEKQERLQGRIGLLIGLAMGLMGLIVGLMQSARV